MRSGRNVALTVAVVAGGLLTAYAAMPEDFPRAMTWLATGLFGMLAIVVATRRARPADSVPGLLLAAAVGLLALGQALTLISGTSPSWADAPRLLAFPVLAMALVTYQRERIHHDRASILDALVITVAAAQAGWLALIDPVLSDSDAGLDEMAVAGGYPLGYLLVLALLTRLVFSMIGSRDASARLLTLGLGIGLGSEIAAAVTDHPGLTVGWMPAAGLIVLATWHPHMAAPPAKVGEARLAAAWRFVVMLGLACLVSPLLVLTYPVTEEATKTAVVLGSAVALFTLALLRIVSLLAKLRRALRREHVLRDSTEILISASDRAGVRDAALAAALELLDQPSVHSWRIDGDPGGTVAQAADDVDGATFLDAAELALFPQGDDGIAVLSGPSLLHGTLGVPSTQTLVLVALPVRGLGREAAVIACNTAPSPRTLAALLSLAATMTLALERLGVDEIQMERRSERRLRLMLQYASDVICILDLDLTVVYVTPAVEPIVGMPAPELLGMNWLDVVAHGDREAARDLMSLAQGGRPARGEIGLMTMSGNARHVDAVVTKVVDEDLMGFVVTCHDITERHELEQQLTHQAFHDALTGLANRALFRDRLGHAMARSRGAGGYAVLFVDLDDFKTVNDSLGHAAGDSLLREMTTRLRSCLRDGDTAARLGGDEFAILLEDVEDDQHAEVIAGRMLLALRTPVDVDGTDISTGASIGIALGQSGPSTPEDLMRNADLALYEAKNAGKNRYAVFAPQMHEVALARLSLTSDLRHAIDRGELVVYYQPLVNLDQGTITGLEALVRWQHPEHGLLQPGQFITLAEETGLIVPLGRWVLRTAVKAAVAWQTSLEGHTALHIAVNVSGRQLQDGGIVDDVRAVIRETGIDPDTLILEITESVLLPGDGTVLARLNELAGLGVHLYIDDFGTGYSSLSYLQMLPVDGLKLAQEFVESLPGTDTESGLVRTIRDLADTLGLASVVAEGIERPEQRASLVSLGYEVGQGFHLALPMPAEKITGYLAGTSFPCDGEWERSQEEALVAAKAAALLDDRTAADHTT